LASIYLLVSREKGEPEQSLSAGILNRPWAAEDMGGQSIGEEADDLTATAKKLHLRWGA